MCVQPLLKTPAFRVAVACQEPAIPLAERLKSIRLLPQSLKRPAPFDRVPVISTGCKLRDDHVHKGVKTFETKYVFHRKSTSFPFMSAM